MFKSADTVLYFKITLHQTLRLWELFYIRSETLLENIEWLKKKGVMRTEETE